MARPLCGTSKSADSRFSEDEGGMGAVYNEEALTISATTIRDNASNGGGGGVYNAIPGMSTRSKAR